MNVVLNDVKLPRLYYYLMCLILSHFCEWSLNDCGNTGSAQRKVNNASTLYHLAEDSRTSNLTTGFIRTYLHAINCMDSKNKGLLLHGTISG